jgi:hypothetical protein
MQTIFFSTMAPTNGEGKGKYPAPLPLEVSKEENNKKKLTFKLFSNLIDVTSAKVTRPYASLMAAKNILKSSSSRRTPRQYVPGST